MKVCYSCKHPRDIIYTDELERGFCSQCYVPRDLMWAVNFMAMTIPYRVGDRVACRTGGQIYDGIGVVEEISTDLKHGGTWVHPMYRVRLTEKAYDSVPDEVWYTEVCMARAEDTVAAGE